MKIYTFLFALLFIAILDFNRAMAIELDTVWVSDINGQVLFQHPITKNIFIATNGGISEVNSQDGKLVRTFPLSGSCIEFSPDGNKVLYCAPDGIRVFNITTLEDVLTITTKYWYPKFLGNDKIVFLSVESNPELGIYDLNTKKSSTHPYENKGLTALSASPNGKYIAYATYEKNNTTDSRTYLYLLDAETMQGLGELGSWDSRGQEIQDITFSPNSKYLTYNIYYTNTTPINIYEIENKSIFKSINSKDIEYGSAGFEFIGNDYYSQVSFSLSNNKYDYGIYKIDSHEMIYQSDNIYNFFYSSKLNSILNHLTYNNRSFNVVCIDFNKIISGVHQTNPLNIKYNNKTLIINNVNNLINNITIMTIEGREVLKQSFEELANMNNPIEIPLELSNGSYIINLVSDKETYTEKIIIVE